jgi:hypothetical protein
MNNERELSRKLQYFSRNRQQVIKRADLRNSMKSVKRLGAVTFFCALACGSLNAHSVRSNDGKSSVFVMTIGASGADPNRGGRLDFHR